MSRWKYRTEKVTVDENTVTVRGLTAGERQRFAEVSKSRKAARDANQDPGDPLAVPKLVAKFGVIDPALSDEELEAMPGDLLDAAVNKILELSGVKGDEKDEKKETPAAVH